MQSLQYNKRINKIITFENNLQTIMSSDISSLNVFKIKFEKKK